MLLQALQYLQWSWSVEGTTNQPMMLVCEHENVWMWALSIYTSRYPTTIEDAYNIDMYNIVTLQL